MSTFDDDFVPLDAKFSGIREHCAERGRSFLVDLWSGAPFGSLNYDPPARWRQNDIAIRMFTPDELLLPGVNILHDGRDEFPSAGELGIVLGLLLGCGRAGAKNYERGAAKRLCGNLVKFLDLP